ncbi:MAG: HAD family hydrolase [Methanobacteriota archaeon]
MNFVAFDLDGVLINSKQAYITAFSKAIKMLGGKSKVSDLAEPLGRPVREVLENILPDSELDVEAYEKLVKHLFSSQEVIDSIPVNPKALRTLEDIKSLGSFRLNLVTNSDKNFTEKILEKHFFSDFFDEVLTADERPIPKENRLRKIIEDCNAFPRKSFYVGDIPADVYAAREVGLKSIAVYNSFSWVFPEKWKIIEAKPDFLIEDLSEIISVISQE